MLGVRNIVKCPYPVPKSWPMDPPKGWFERIAGWIFVDTKQMSLKKDQGV